MTFDQSLSYLLSLGHETLAMKLGLQNIELLLTALDHPQKTYPAVQIAGTNGKGSTAVMLDSICRAADLKTGLFTSPHLIRITERIKVGGHEITKSEFARLATVVRETVQHLLADQEIAAPLTFFEQVTAIAFLAFAEAQVELAILETGLGGRLDSTTVAQAKTVAVTSIALDHQEYLGESLAEIAAEKAAIIRPGVQAIIAPQTDEVRDVILRRSAQCGVVPQFNDGIATVTGATEDGQLKVTFQTNWDRYDEVTLGLRGRHQVVNAGVAIRLAESLRERGFQIPQSAIIQGLEGAKHAGRLELRAGHPALLFDGAHNPAGARALCEYLNEFARGPVTLIFGAMRDKDLIGITTELLPLAQRVILTRPANQRAATLAELETLVPKEVGSEAVAVAPTASDALDRAYQLTPSDGLICITGSLYLIGEVQERLSQTAEAEVANRSRGH
jgi:dihydrofolate synthase/folylpolyglutamate synthase